MVEAKTHLLSLLQSKKFWLVGVLLTFLLHAPFLNRPPESEHTWRQCNTLAMSRNFYQEGMNILKPRVDNRMWTDGVTGSQFPSYEFGLASLYHITGEQFWVHRGYSFLLYLLGALGMFYLYREVFGVGVGTNLAFWGYLWSPILFYHGINALPDILALPASIWGLLFFLRWKKGRDNPSGEYQVPRRLASYFWASLGLVILAGLTKLQFLAIGFFILGYLFVFLKNLNVQQSIKIGFYGVFAVIIPLAWYAYARYLIQQSGLADFGLELRPEDDLYKGLSILYKNISSDFPELLLNYGGFVFLLAGIYFYQGIKKTSPYRWGILLWAFGLLAYHIIELSQMRAHQYYMLPYLPLLLLFAGYGAEQLLKGRAWWLAALLLVGQPIFAGLRILPSRWMSDRKVVPTELYQVDSRQRLAEMVPDSALCVVGVDDSNCIYFYFLGKKGFGSSYPEELLKIMPWGEMRLDYYIRKGGKYLYLDDEGLFRKPEVQSRVKRVIGQEGRFFVVELLEVETAYSRSLK